MILDDVESRDDVAKFSDCMGVQSCVGSWILNELIRNWVSSGGEELGSEHKKDSNAWAFSTGLIHFRCLRFQKRNGSGDNCPKADWLRRTHSPEVTTSRAFTTATSTSGQSKISTRRQISGCWSLTGNEYLTAQTDNYCVSYRSTSVVNLTLQSLIVDIDITHT